jgi:hypothetical protein
MEAETCCEKSIIRNTTVASAGKNIYCLHHLGFTAQLNICCCLIALSYTERFKQCMSSIFNNNYLEFFCMSYNI